MARSDPQPRQSHNLALRAPRAWLVLLLVLAAGVTFDLWTKYWSFASIADAPVELDRERFLTDPNYHPIPPHQGVSALPWNLLDFRLVVNHGAVFGIGQDQRFFFIAFTIAALAVGLFVFARFTRARDHFIHTGLGLILAGGLGNLYDRIVYGVVRDFLHMLPGWHLPFGLTWPGNNPELFPWVFNIADVMLLSGMVILFIHLHRVESRRKAEEEAAGNAEKKPSTRASESSSGPPSTSTEHGQTSGSDDSSDARQDGNAPS